MKVFGLEVLQQIKHEDLHILMMNQNCPDLPEEVCRIQTLIGILIDLRNLDLSIEDLQVEKIIKKNIQMMKIMEDDHRGRQSLSRLSVEGQEILVLQKSILEERRETGGEWNDLIPNLPQIEHQALEIGELADKKLGKGLVLQQVVKHQVEEEMEHLLISLKYHLQE